MNLGTDAYFDRMQGRLDDEAADWERAVERARSEIESDLISIATGRDGPCGAADDLLENLFGDGLIGIPRSNLAKIALAGDPNFTHCGDRWDLSGVVDSFAERMAEQRMAQSGDDV